MFYIYYITCIIQSLLVMARSIISAILQEYHDDDIPVITSLLLPLLVTPIKMCVQTLCAWGIPFCVYYPPGYRITRIRHNGRRIHPHNMLRDMEKWILICGKMGHDHSSVRVSLMRLSESWENTYSCMQMTAGQQRPV